MIKMNTSKFKIIFSILFVVIICLIVFCVIRLKGGKVVHPNKNITVAENVIFYRQDDSSWAADKLGNSEYIMKDSGCLITCIASALSMSGEEMTPGQLNLCCSEDGYVYDSEGNLLWNGFRESTGFDVRVYSEVSENILIECLEEGIFPIVRVRVSGVGNFHYVLIVKSENEIFYCMDPLKDGLIPLSQYGNRVYAIRAVGP